MATDLQAPYIETRHLWTDPWVAWPYCEVESFTACVSPSIPVATLRRSYGRISDHGAAVVDYEACLSAHLGDFVRIMRPAGVEEIFGEATYSDAYPVWHGLFTSVDDLLFGEDPVPAGDERGVARGLEVLLQRCNINGSMWETDVGAAPIEEGDIRLPFNFWNHKTDSLVGNRSSSKQYRYGEATGSQSYVFSDSDGDLWTGSDVVEYLLVQYGPKSPAIAPTGATANLALFQQSWGPFQTVTEGLNAIVTRSRGHAWNICVAEPTAPGENETVTVNVYPCFGADVAEAGLMLTGAPITLALDGDVDTIASLTIRHSDEHRYDRIEVRGSPIIAMGTLTMKGAGNGGTADALTPAWAAAQETAYEAAQEADRTAEKYAHVFRAFRIDTDLMPMSLRCDDDGNITILDAYTTDFFLGKRFCRELPMPVTADDTSGPKGLRPMYVFAKWNDGSDHYAPLDRIKAREDAGMGAMQNCNCYSLDGEMGIRVVCSPNYLLADNKFVDTSASAQDWPLLDYDNLYATVAWPTSEHLKIAVAVEGDGAPDRPRTLTIDVPQAQAWYIHEGTYVDIAADVPQFHSDFRFLAGAGPGATYSSMAGVLRSDTAVLKTVAAMAKAWYARRRSAITVTYAEMVYILQSGWLVKTVGHADMMEDVNTIITHVTWDCNAGTTLVRTDFVELDYSAMVGRSGGAGMRMPRLAAGGIVGGEPDNLPARLAPGGEGAGTRTFAVMVTKDGGVSGGAAAECTYTYTVKNLAEDVTLGTLVTPQVPRLHFCAYWFAGETRTAPAVATSRRGLAYYDENGTLILQHVPGEIGKEGPIWPGDGDDGDIWYHGDDTWDRLAAPEVEGPYKLHCDVDASGNPTLSWELDRTADGGIERSCTHRIRIRDGAAGGTYEFDSGDWRGRLLNCSLQTVYSNSPATEQWGGGASTVVSRFFGSGYNGADRSLIAASGGSPAVMIDGGTGNLYWSWEANATGYDLYAACMVEATQLMTTDDHTVDP